MQKFLTAILFFLLTSTARSQPGSMYLHYREIRKNFAPCFEKTNISLCDDALWHMSFTGLIDSATLYANIRYNRTFPTGKIDPAFAQMKAIPAINYIINRVGNARVVMLNEQHYYPPNRIFTTEVLMALKQQGFNYLGCEGIYQTEALTQKGYPDQETGFYINEPQYANMIREALKMGYHIFAYDTPGGTIDERETGQACAIYNVIKKDSSAKIIIHAGLGHIREDTTRGLKLMAWYFKQLSGIDPFTINQAGNIENSEAKFETPLYQQAGSSIKEPSVFYNPQTNIAFGDSDYDLSVFHPRTVYSESRASWLHNSYLLKHSVQIPADLNFPLLIKVYRKEEYKDDLAIPMDAFELLQKQRSVAVFVPFHGDYVVVMDDGKQKGSILFKQ